MLAITGAAGFIGSHLAHCLARMGYELLLADHPVTSSKRINLQGLEPWRLLEQEQFLECLRHEQPSLEAVFHLGACSATTMIDWPYLQRNNVEYSQQLWRWCASQSVPLIYASSAATYGDGAQGFDDRTPPTQLEPLNLYGKSKNDFDIWASAQAQHGPPRWAGVKFFNVYGPRETHKGPMASVVWQAFRQVQEHGAIRLFRSSAPTIADGAQKRDFVFVEDCVQHLVWLWQNGPEPGLYNSGTGRARSFLELASAVFSALGRKPLIEFIPMSPSIASHYQNFTQADMSRLHEAGCTAASTTLEEGVRRTIAGYREQAMALGDRKHTG